MSERDSRMMLKEKIDAMLVRGDECVLVSVSINEADRILETIEITEATLQLKIKAIQKLSKLVSELTDEVYKDLAKLEVQIKTAQPPQQPQ